ncbi:glycosyltransferase [Paenibacillus aquistagni]|uniref:Glycosyltransferase, GT2 family n=1 Tax=Paenibacillus aquistagni TaxID=1852522 RepID=A0A1X7KZY5_9BACL|nr:glycosyltransferase [Paenibacillus aquistagni]SMG46602.1 Glycosyltransferase, GT2 family [Paenibacillus aquistagni]
MKFTGERYIPNMQDYTLEAEHLQRYASVTSLVKDKVVIDAACGEGYGTKILSNYASKVIGIDISSEAIRHAKNKYSQDNIEFIEGSIERLDLPSGSVDVFISFETIEHVDETTQHSFLNEIKRVLKHDGILVISTPEKSRYTDARSYINPFHVKEFYEAEFHEFLGRYFSHINFYFQGFEIISTITNQQSKSLTNINHEDNNSHDGMYIIAICSNQHLKSVTIDSYLRVNELSYSGLVSRIVELQAEVQSRNEHIKKLDIIIDEKGLQIRESQSELDSLGTHLKKLDDCIIDKNLQIQKLQNDSEQLEVIQKKLNLEIESKEKDVCKLKDLIVQADDDNKQKTQIIENHKAHINMLLEQERKLNAIYESGGWKLLNKYYFCRDKVFPQRSKRRLIAQLLFKFMKNPRFMIRSLNKQNLKKMKYYVKTESMDRLNSRIDNYVEKHAQTTETRDLNLMKNVDATEKIVFQSVNADNNILVSIIIPVYNQWEYTYSCLKSILEHTKDVSYEIIIADDVSTDETQNINDIVENITVVRDEVNRGFLLNCNNASQYAKGKYLFFLNNDTNVQPEWLTSLLDVIENDSNVGMVGSKLVYPDGRQQEAGGIIWNDASGWNYGRLDDPDKPEYNYLREVDYISGAAIMIRKSIWDQLGGFDERYVPAYFEDTDLAFEVRRLGYKVVLQPKSVVVHFEGISHGTDTSSGIKSYQVVNKEKFHDKWGLELKTFHYNNAENVFLARDRSRNKKTIVIVDHYVPHYDKDAGGRCTYFYTKLFVSLGYKVIFIGDNFFKHEPYTQELQQLGVEVLYGNWYAKNIMQWIKDNGDYFDFVYLNRPHISVKYIDAFRKYSRAKIIYFGHDLHFLREMRNYEITKNESLLKSSNEWKVVEYELFNKADVIHVVGSHEQQLLQKEFPAKEIRNIPLFIYPKPQRSINSYENREDLLFVGGFNHKPNYDGVLWFVKEVWPEISKSLPHVKFYIVGSNPPEDIQMLQSENIVVTGYVTDEQLEGFYSKCRVVVVPLRFGAGVKGKVIEAMYYQTPMVTTSIGAEGLENVHASLEIADDEIAFSNAIVNIYRNATLWSQLSSNSAYYIEKNFSVEAARSIISIDIN